MPLAARQRPRPLAVVVLLIAALATVATSPPLTDLSVEERGPSVLLSPDEPEVTVRFKVEPNDVTLEAPELRVHISHEAFWEDLERDRFVDGKPFDDRTPTVDADAGRGGEPPQPINWERSLCVGAPHACVGTYEVTFRWPRGVVASSARIAWSVEAIFDFQRDAPHQARGVIIFEPLDGDQEDFAGGPPSA